MYMFLLSNCVVQQLTQPHAGGIRTCDTLHYMNMYGGSIEPHADEMDAGQ